MPVNVSWVDDKKTIIRLDFSEPYTVEDFVEALLAQQPFFDSATVETVHLIYCQNGLPMPKGVFKRLPQIQRQSPATNHPRAGKIIYVGISTGAEATINVFMNTYPEKADRFRFTNTVKEAFALIERLKDDPTAI